MTKTVLTVLLACGVFATAAAGNRSGSVGGQFLKIPLNARATAMGNAQVPLAEGAASIGFNSAGTLSIPTASFAAMYQGWFADITHAFVGGAMTFEGIGTVGLGVIILTTDDMNVTTSQFPEGTGELFKSTEYAFHVSFARQISQQFGLGLTFKYIRSNLSNADITASSIAFDIGTLYDIDELRTRLGISVNNLGRDLKYLNEQYSLPTVLRFGARTNVWQDDVNGFFVAAQVGRPNDAEEQYNLGVEYSYTNMIFLRTGYRFNYDTENWSAGLGVDLATVGVLGKIDYSYTNYRYLPGTHMFSLEMGF